MRAADLRFTRMRRDALLATPGSPSRTRPSPRLRERTEGWAAGLRLAAMFLAATPRPREAVAEFSGTERTVAEYLLGEVLAHQPEDVRDLLLRTWILDRVNGRARRRADRPRRRRAAPARARGGQRVRRRVDAERTWFRYHQLLADLLRVELRRQLPGGARPLHRRASRWLAERGLVAAALRQAEQAEDFALAATLLADHWPALLLDGAAPTLTSLLRALPDKLAETDAEIAVTSAADRLRCGQWQEADAHLAKAAELAPTVRTRRRAASPCAWRSCAHLRRPARRRARRPRPLRGRAAPRRARPARARARQPRRRRAVGGRLDAADRHLGEAIDLAEDTERPLVAIGALGHAALIAGAAASCATPSGAPARASTSRAATAGSPSRPGRRLRGARRRRDRGAAG